MKLTRYSAATSLLFISGLASAQTSSVILYGVADVGIEYLTNVPNAANNASNLVRMTSGDLAASRWGIRGTESLGGNLTALFVLEGGITLDDGKMGQNNRLFGRKAYLGLSSKQYGELTFGRQQSLVFDVLIPYDPMYFSPFHSAFAHDVGLAAKVDNSVKYVGRAGGFTATALYSFGADSTVAGGSEVPGDPKVGRDLGFGLTYEFGKLRLSGVFEQQNGQSVATVNQTQARFGAGVAYYFENLTLSAAYRRLNSDVGTGPVRTDLYWVGAAWTINPAWTLRAAVYRTNDRLSNKDPISFVLSGEYSLSKRTSLYATSAFARNANGSALAVSYGAPVVAGENQFGMAVGVKHTF
ncbi:MAG: porin [Pseudomonadales bacterium]